jgi:hypothetical protein
MPSVSERRALIDTVLRAADESSAYHMGTDLDDDDMDSDMSESQVSSTSDSSSDFDSSSSSSSSSSSETETDTSSKIMSVDDGDTDEEYSMQTSTTADLLQVITTTRVLNPHQVPKVSQLTLILTHFKNDDPKRFRNNLRVSPSTFDGLEKMIADNPIFYNSSPFPQGSVSAQLATTLFRFGHDGNAASVEAVAQWAGICAGTVVNWTRRVMLAFLALHDSAVHWPSEEEKEEAKDWVESVSCPAWRDGFCMVDGTPAILFQKPGYHGEAYFDRKSNYSLNVQVSAIITEEHPLMFFLS